MSLDMAMESKITQALQSIARKRGFEGQIKLDRPKDFKHGDFTSNIALQLASLQKKNPVEIAQEMVHAFPSLPELSRVEVVKPGFINFHLSPTYLTEFVSTLFNLDGSERAQKVVQSFMPNVGHGRVAIVEYSSPNIAKPFTIGHLRSTIIGDAVANLLAATGWEVKRDNHLGDWGTQFGKQIYALLHLGEGSLEKNIQKITESAYPVKELVELYIEFHAKAENDPTLEDEARAWFKRLEDGDAQARKLWQMCIDWSWKEFSTIYGRLDVTFTENDGRGFGESYFEDKMGSVVQELQDKGLLKESDGAQLVFFPQDMYPPLMILKKDGSTLYSTRDLATDFFRIHKSEYGKDPLIINEVGAEQALYFKQIFELEKMLGWIKEGQRVHVKHGLYRFKEGKMSTRKGNVIWLKDVLDEAYDRAFALIADKAEFSEAEKKDIAEKISIGAIKWNDLKRSAHLDVSFDWDEILNMEGNSGASIAYAAVRIKSIARKVKESLSTSDDKKVMPTLPFSDSHELELAQMLYQYPLMLEQAALQYAPHLLVNYLFELTQAFNRFYAHCQVLGSGENEPGRLQLAAVTHHILVDGLKTLGIPVPERM